MITTSTSTADLVRRYVAFQPTNWRWRVAQGSPVRHPLSPEDDYSRAARAFLRKYDPQPGDEQYHARFPTIVAAEFIWIEEALVRAELEANVIAGRTVREIAERLERPLRLVEWYERLFFDVRDRPRFFFEQTVVQPLLPMSPYCVGRIWSYFALNGGPVVLDAVIDDFRRSGRPDYSHFLREPPEPGRDAVRAGVQTAVLERILPLHDPRQQTKLMQVLINRAPIRHPADPRGDAVTRLSRFADVALQDALTANHDSAAAGRLGTTLRSRGKQPPEGDVPQRTLLLRTG